MKNKINRRKFMTTGMAAVALPSLLNIQSVAMNKTLSDNKTSMRIGIITGLDSPRESIKRVRDFGFDACQVSAGEFTPGIAAKLKAALQENDVIPVTMICHGPGPYVWDFKQGPVTIGLVPREYRVQRVERLKQGVDICAEAGVPAIHAHFGFIPEFPGDELYIEFVEVMKDLGAYAKNAGIDIYFETGQETPVTLFRAIQDIGTGNLFVNYDTANLILYGKANPLDGLIILGKLIKSFHIKDGFYPTDPYRLGKEAPIPEGLVDFPKIIAYMKNLNFEGSLVIENEMSSNTRDYLIKTKKYLEGLIGS